MSIEKAVEALSQRAVLKAIHDETVVACARILRRKMTERGIDLTPPECDDLALGVSVTLGLCAGQVVQARAVVARH